MEISSAMSKVREDISTEARVSKRDRSAGKQTNGEQIDGFSAILAQAGAQAGANVVVPTPPTSIQFSDAPSETSPDSVPESVRQASTPIIGQADEPDGKASAQGEIAQGSGAAATSVTPGTTSIGSDAALVEQSVDTMASTTILKQATPHIAPAQESASAQDPANLLAQLAQLGLSETAADQALTAAPAAGTSNSPASAIASPSLPTPATPAPATPAPATPAPATKARQSANASSDGQANLANTSTNWDDSQTQTVTREDPAQVNQTANDNAATQGSVKTISAQIMDVQIPIPNAPSVSSSNDGSSLTPQAQLGDAALPTPEAARLPQLTPQIIPMLAATMMRRFESGARQFTMRLDPPELGQVEVKLTVGVDKKVRAVVSADRPEALADLVRSARELTRALFDAGLELEERGLTFTLNDAAGNDTAGSRQHGQREQQRAGQSTETQLGRASDLETAHLTHGNDADTSNDPFQRWQRARIALTA